MQKSDKHHILPSHHDSLSDTFENIIDLIESGDNKNAKRLLVAMHHADFADFLDNTNHKIHEKALYILDNEFKSETLIWINSSTRHSIEDIVPAVKIAGWIDELDTEDAIEVIEDFSIDMKNSILELISKEKKQYILEGFTYRENTAGRVMEKEFVSFLDYWTVGQAIDSIRHNNSEKDFHGAIVVDSRNKPTGNISLCTLLKNPRNIPIRTLMNEDFKIADTNTDLEQLSYIFKQYALTIVPIVNKTGKIVGTVSIDNMIYIVEQQAEEDIMHLGGLNVQDNSYSLLFTAKHRFSWLFINLVTAFLTAIVINQFSDTIAKIVTLASIMPIVASIGGNAGMQTMTVTVRALSSKDLTHTNYKKTIIKELLVCGLNGIALSILGGAFTFLLFNNIELSIIFIFAVLINFLVAGLFGSAIPIILDNFDIDPATSSGVLLSVLTDSFGFFTFLILAYLFLI